MSVQEVEGGRFVRQANRFTDRITADGSSGYPAEAGRYRLFVSYACPWAQRTLIVRRLLGLEEAISVAVVDPIRDERGWRLPERDPVTGAEFLSELYLGTDPSFTGRYTVPCIWDTKTGRLVTNDFPVITTMMETEFTAHHRPGARPVPGGAPPRDRRAQRPRLPHRQQRGLQGRVRHLAGRLRGGRRRPVRDPRPAGGAPVRPALPVRRRDHRGRRPPLPDARALRRRLLLPLQVQHPAPDGLPEPVGLRPRPLLDPRVRRDHELRPHQAPLLRDPAQHQPVGRRPQGPDHRLERTARAGSLTRPPRYAGGLPVTEPQ